MRLPHHASGCSCTTVLNVDPFSLYQTEPFNLHLRMRTVATMIDGAVVYDGRIM